MARKIVQTQTNTADASLDRRWHLAQSATEVDTTELEFALMRAFEGFGRWQSECLASVCDLAATGPENALLHIIRMNNRPKSLKEIARLMNRDDVPNIQYSLRKLLGAGLVARQGAGRSGVTYDCTEEGRRVTDDYAVLRRKLAECGLEGLVPLIEVPLGGRFHVGPFALELVTLTHSIPEPNGVVIRTPAGTVFHTGDWKLDPDPVVGPVSDEESLRRLQTEPVLAMVCDSTNVFEPKTSGSEGALRGPLTEIIGRCTRGVAVTCFATNVARLKTIARAAAAAGREVALVGASLKRISATARECGDALRRFLDGRAERERCCCRRRADVSRALVAALHFDYDGL